MVISYSYRLNFIIAIIVEAYMKVVKKVAEQESDQEFVTDVVSTLYATTKSIAYNWVNRPQGSPCLVNTSYTCVAWRRPLCSDCGAGAFSRAIWPSSNRFESVANLPSTIRFACVSVPCSTDELIQLCIQNAFALHRLMRCSLSSGVKLILLCEQVLRLMFPAWRRNGILSFMHHYNRYKYMHMSFQVCRAPSIYLHSV